MSLGMNCPMSARQVFCEEPSIGRKDEVKDTNIVLKLLNVIRFSYQSAQISRLRPPKADKLEMTSKNNKSPRP